MKKHVYIGLGGFAGAILRFAAKSAGIGYGFGWIPLHTLAVNLAGCLAIGLVMTLALETRRISEPVRLGIVTGFLGALTTFSSICREIVQLLQQGWILPALVYAALSLALGLASVFLASRLAHIYLNRRRPSGGDPS